MYLLRNYIDKDIITIGDCYVNSNQVRFAVKQKLISTTEILLTVHIDDTTSINAYQGLHSTLKDVLGIFGESITKTTTKEDIEASLEFFEGEEALNVKVLKASFIEYLENNKYSIEHSENKLVLCKNIFVSYNVVVNEAIEEDFNTYKFVAIKGKYLDTVSSLAKKGVDVYNPETAYLLSNLPNINLDSVKVDLEKLKNRLVIL